MTAEGVFASPWISSDEHASSVHLPHFTANLKKYNARRKFKGGVDAVIAELRLLQAAGGASDKIFVLNSSRVRLVENR